MPAISWCILLGLVALDEVGLVAVTAEQLFQFVVADAGQHGRVGDLVAVEVQDGQHGAVVDGIEELVRVPTGGQRPGLRLAVADDAGDEQVGIVEGRAVGMGQGVAEFAAFVDRAGRFGRDVAGDAAGERELGEQAFHARFVLGDVGIELAVGAFQVGVGHHAGSAVAGAGDEDGVQVILLDDAVQVDVEEVQARAWCPSGRAGAASRAPV